tara:strand:+ start:2189 stop:2389 length:201 start_codon:yes stop_codon:yes gene_type:complete
MQVISLEYLEANFEELVDRAHAGETFLIDTPDGQIALVPHKDVLKPVIDSGQAQDIEHMWNHDDGA